MVWQYGPELGSLVSVCDLDMPRYKLIIEYDGTPFHGWQRQVNGCTVQECVEHAVLRFCGERVTLNAAGRTDAGVHALGQVVHVDLVRNYPAHTVQNALNFHLRPNPIAVINSECVDKNFHARFSAIGRHYRYRILNRLAPPVVDLNRVWHVPVPLDAVAMHSAAQSLVGQYDFTTFRAAQCQAKSPLRTLTRLDVDGTGDEITVEASARSFLHHQVRAIVGTSKLVGEGKWPVSQVSAALAACDRSCAGPTAPARGLYLIKVNYAQSKIGESTGCA